MNNSFPQLGADRFNCPRCHAYSAMVWRDLQLHARTASGSSTFAFSDSAPSFFVEGTSVLLGTPVEETRWRIALCSSCQQSSVWQGERLVFPSASIAPSPHPDMPASAKELYEEAAAVLPISRRASAALVRAALERLLREVEGADPKDRLDDLIGKLNDKVGAPLWRVLTALRVLGNDTLHGDNDELVTMFLTGDASTVAEPFFAAINMVVEEIITQPRKAAELYAMIPQTKRDVAERKAQQNKR